MINTKSLLLVSAVALFSSGVVLARVGLPIGAEKPLNTSIRCALLNGATITVPIKGPNGGTCNITSTLSNCKLNEGGDCVCTSTVTDRTGDCGDD